MSQPFCGVPSEPETWDDEMLALGYVRSEGSKMDFWDDDDGYYDEHVDDDGFYYYDINRSEPDIITVSDCADGDALEFSTARLAARRPAPLVDPNGPYPELRYGEWIGTHARRYRNRP